MSVKSVILMFLIGAFMIFWVLLYIIRNEENRVENRVKAQQEENAKPVDEDAAVDITEKILRYNAYGLSGKDLHPREFVGMTRGVIAGLVEKLGEKGDPYIRIRVEKIPESIHVNTFTWNSSDRQIVRSLFWVKNEWLLVDHRLNCKDKKRWVYKGKGWAVGEKILLRFDTREGYEAELADLGLPVDISTCKWSFD